MNECLCESSMCEHHEDQCSNLTSLEDNTRELGNVCLDCRLGYSEAGYPLHLSNTALQARDRDH